MWGHIITEASYQYNFNLGFSTTRSDILVHLAQWQYWWWFWFSFLWTFYYLISLKLLRHRSLKMHPKISTSYRPHGKWGDFLACTIPAIWVINILTNSNYILRLIEWQSESSLFTIRVRAKQWYWIYKFELKNFTDILTTPKNIGTNKWVINTFGDLSIVDDYLHILQMRAQNNWVLSYWKSTLQESNQFNKNSIVSPQEQFKIYNNNNINIIEKINKVQQLSYNNGNDIIVEQDINKYNNTIVNNNNLIFFFKINFSKKITKLFLISDLFSNYKFENKISKQKLFNINLDLCTNKYINLPENSRWIKRSFGVHSPIRLIKLPVEKNNIELFRIRFNNGQNLITEKILPHNRHFVLKQNRYNRKKKISPIITYTTSIFDSNIKNIKYSNKPILINNSTLNSIELDPTINYKLIKKAKIRNDVMPVTLNRRLLRTKNTLVLPAHINITLITNSYDIVHSWFIPGLGIKLDCVPGRSTHHTFYIDSIGFYYGQCAEICGRYHHHMPIRICALQFEHFLIWWQTFGLPKLINTSLKKNYNNNYINRKYIW